MIEMSAYREISRKYAIALTFFTALCALTPGAAPLAARDVIDQTGRPVGVPENPRRVVAFAPSITEIVFALQQDSRLAGATQFSNYPPAASKLPRVGSYVRLSLEKIVALEPDLCLAIKDGNPKTVIDRLQAMGIPVYVVNPHDLDSVTQTMKALGHLLHATQRAETLTRSIQDRLQKVSDTVARASRSPKVFIQIGISPIISAGSNTFLNDLIQTAGGVNAAAGNNP